MLSHMANIAECEACGARSTCDIFGSPSNPSSMLLCALCTQKEIDANSVVLQRSQMLIDESREIDSSIRYNGDFFNAKVIAISAIKAAIDADDLTYPDAQSKQYRFQDVIAERYKHLKDVIFDVDEQKHQAVAEQSAIRHSLREFGNELRASIRETIKTSDANYTPQAIIKTPKITKPKASPMDRLVEAMAAMKGISKESAREMIERGNTK